MLSKFQRSIAGVVVVAISTLVLSACGAGNRSGGGGIASSLQLLSPPGFGVLDANDPGNPTVQAFNVMTPSVATMIGETTFPTAGATDSHFLELSFNTTVLPASVQNGQFSGFDGIEVRDSNGVAISFFMDEAGAIDPSNTFIDALTAPSTLRLYFQDIANPGVPVALADGQYTVNIITNNVRSSNNRPFCLRASGGSCINDVEVVYSFSVGADTTPITAASNPSNPLLNTAIAIDDEIRIFFSEAVDFQSVIGAANGTPNTTAIDQFMSVPFPLNNTAGGMSIVGENISVAYTAPPPANVPLNYGFVVYMPDPFHNPTELRIRFVDGTLLNFTDTAQAPQNYGISSVTWNLGGLPAPTNAMGLNVELPPKLPLPGSDANGPANINITIFGTGNALASDSSNISDGVLGFADRARNGSANDFVVTYTVQQGPVIANNPSPPDLNIVTNGAVLGAVSSGALTVNSTPGGILIGQVRAVATPLDDPTLLGNIGDVAFGAFLGPNGLGNPPRRNNNAGIIAGGGDPAVPFPPGATPEAGLAGNPPTPPLGVRLYVVDTSANEVKMFDSTTFLPLGSLTGVPSPRGLGIDPTATFMYISNFDQGTVQRVGINPGQTALFHQITATIPVGAGPENVIVTFENEDVFTINTQDNSISKIDVATGLEVAVFPTGMGARDLMAAPRMNCMGCTLAYQIFVTNQMSDTVTVFESDSILPQVQNGTEGKIIDTIGGWSGPSFGVSNRVLGSGVSGFGSQGVIIANSTGTTADYLALVAFGLGPAPGFMGPPSFRTFQIVQSYGAPLVGSPGDVTIDTLTFLANNAARVVLANWTAAGQVAAIDYNSGAFYGSAAVPGNKIYSFLDQ